MLRQETVLHLLNKLLGQTAKIRRESDAVYFCPNCKHYKRKLEINLVTGKYNCWVCNFRGSSIQSLLRKLNASSEYYTLLGTSNSYSSKPFVLDFSNSEDSQSSILQLPDEFKPLSTMTDNIEYSRAINYLIGRNVTYTDIIRYNIGYCDSGTFKGRVIIPSYDKKGNLNFFYGRNYNDDVYFKHKLCNFSKNIIGFEMLINFEEPITLVEGQFDAIAVRRNCIPLFGKIMSKKLKSAILESNTPRVNVLLDNDALSDSIKICQYLISNNIPTHLVKLEKKDPSILGFENTWKYINESSKITFEDIIKFKIDNKL